MAESLKGDRDKYYTCVLQTAAHSVSFQMLRKPACVLYVGVSVLWKRRRSDCSWTPVIKGNVTRSGSVLQLF